MTARGNFGWLGALVGSALVLLMAGAMTSVAAADRMAIQPDGKIVISGKTRPEFGALARLDADGRLDRTFGTGGFALDYRMSTLQAIALSPDGRILGAGPPGLRVARYLADGSVDPSFADGAFGGTPEPDQFWFEYADEGAQSILTLADGSFVVAGNRTQNHAGDEEAFVRRYDANGSLLETIGHVAPIGGSYYDSDLRNLRQAPDGSLVGAGFAYAGTQDGKGETTPLLARFVPGSGTDFDPAFGGGVGLVRPPITPETIGPNGGSDIAFSGGRILLAGNVAKTMMLARFDGEGKLDTGFGGGKGYVAPAIVGPSNSRADARSWAGAIAVTESGDAVLGGGTSQWGTWQSSRDIGEICSDCPQPLVARLDAEGNLDPAFGSGGYERLLTPTGGVLVGEVDQVASVPGGETLVEGQTRLPGGEVAAPFVARLRADGSYDPSFGEGGLTILRFPCNSRNQAMQRRTGCMPSTELKAKLHGLRRGRPSLALSIKPNLSWAAIGSLTLPVPKSMRLSRGFRSKLRIETVGSSGGRWTLFVEKPRGGRGQAKLEFSGPGAPRAVKLVFKPGALHFKRGKRPRRVRLELSVRFRHAAWEDFLPKQTVVRRLR